MVVDEVRSIVKEMGGIKAEQNSCYEAEFNDPNVDFTDKKSELDDQLQERLGKIKSLISNYSASELREVADGLMQQTKELNELLKDNPQLKQAIKGEKEVIDRCIQTIGRLYQKQKQQDSKAQVTQTNTTSKPTQQQRTSASSNGQSGQTEVRGTTSTKPSPKVNKTNYMKPYPSSLDNENQIQESIEAELGTSNFDVQNLKHKEIVDKIYSDEIKESPAFNTSKEASENLAIEYLEDSDYLHPSTLTALAQASAYRENGKQTDKAKECTDKLKEMANKGADIYSARVVISRTLRTHYAVDVKANSVSMNQKKLQEMDDPAMAETQIKDLARTDSILTNLHTPYDNLFEQLEQIEELKRIANKKETQGDYSQSDYYQEKISSLRETVSINASKFDPDMLMRVANSKRELEVEDQKFERGYDNEMEQSGQPFVVSSTASYMACNELKKIAREIGKQKEYKQQKISE